MKDAWETEGRPSRELVYKPKKQEGNIVWVPSTIERRDLSGDLPIRPEGHDWNKKQKTAKGIGRSPNRRTEATKEVGTKNAKTEQEQKDMELEKTEMTKTYPAITRQQKKKNKQTHKGEGIHLIHVLLHPLQVQVGGKDHANILTTRAKAFHLMRHKVSVHPNNGLHTGLRWTTCLRGRRNPALPWTELTKSILTSMYHVGSTWDAMDFPPGSLADIHGIKSNQLPRHIALSSMQLFRNILTELPPLIKGESPVPGSASKSFLLRKNLTTLAETAIFRANKANGGLLKKAFRFGDKDRRLPLSIRKIIGSLRNSKERVGVGVEDMKFIESGN